MEKLLVKKDIFKFSNKSKFKNSITLFLLVLPYLLGFFIFIVLPIIIAIYLSFTNFNTVSMPKFIGLDNYISILTRDDLFMKYVIPNTLTFSFVAGPIGFIMSFFLAWILAQLPKRSRTILALIIYSPSMAAGATMTIIWKTLFSGDVNGLLNSYMLQANLIDQPIQWLQDVNYLMPIMIIVTIWGSMGVGFLAMMAGVMNIDQEIYEAAYIDGIKNRFQEIIHVTIPSMKPQMLFGAVMAVVGTFSAGGIGVELSGANPTPQYAGQMIVNHIIDYGLIRFEMGYAAAVSVVLLLIIYITSKVVFKLLKEKTKSNRKV